MSTASIAEIFKIEDKYFKTDFSRLAADWQKVDVSLLPRVKETNTSIGIEVEMEHTYEMPHGLHEALWTYRADGSLRNNGLEAVSIPIAGEWIGKALKSLFDIIKTSKFSPRTSIHIHLDVRKLTQKQLTAIILVYLSVESLLYKFVGKDRHENIFCVPLYTTAIVNSLVDLLNKSLVKSNFGNARYAGLNLDSLRKFGTIEFRQMHGTHDVIKIMNWINLIFSIQQFALKHSLDELIAKITELNTNSFYIAYLNDVFDNCVSLLDISDLKQDLEKGVKAVKQSIISNKFSVELQREFSRNSPAMIQYRKQVASNYARKMLADPNERVE